MAEQNTQRPPTRPEKYFESKQTYFSYSLDKVFHLPEFFIIIIYFSREIEWAVLTETAY